jgi:hypothetical protein
LGWFWSAACAPQNQGFLMAGRPHLTAPECGGTVKMWATRLYAPLVSFAHLRPYTYIDEQDAVRGLGPSLRMTNVK